jgi:hypothetical protein
MKSLSRRSSHGSNATTDITAINPHCTVLGSIPGLERLLPGYYLPGHIVESRYGKWTLARSFKGHPITAIIDGTLLG